MATAGTRDQGVLTSPPRLFKDGKDEPRGWCFFDTKYGEEILGRGGKPE